jgi:hypothetical protein
MRLKQKGFLVSVMRIMAFVFFSLAFLYLACGFPANISYIISNHLDLVSSLAVLFPLLLFILICFSIGNYFAWMFPDLLIGEDVIKLQFLIFRKCIPISSGMAVTVAKWGLHAITLKKRGLLLFRLYGLFVARQWDQPAILISLNQSDLENLASAFVQK